MQRNYRVLVKGNAQAIKQPQQDNLVAGVIFLYTLYLLAPVLQYTYSFGWYAHLALCVMVFLIYRQKIDMSVSKIYVAFSVLYFIGALLSSLRVIDISSHLYLLVGNSVGFFTYFLLIPAFSSPKVRIAFLAAIVVAGLAWTFMYKTNWLIFAIFSLLIISKVLETIKILSPLFYL